MTVHIDDLREKSLSELIEVALTLEDPSSFWVVAGILSAKASENHQHHLARELWRLAHVPLAQEQDALTEAKALLRTAAKP